MRQPFKPLAAATTGDTYAWIPVLGGSESWSSPSTWKDTTAGTTGQSAPTAGSTVVVDAPPGYSADFYGGGAARAATFDGSASLQGKYRFDHLLASGELFLAGSVSTGEMTVDTFYLDGVSLDVRGTLRVTGEIDPIAAVGDDIAVGRLALAHASIGASPGCTIEIGHAGHAQAGAVTVDRGATLIGSGDVLGTLIDNGLVDARGLIFLSTVTGTGTIRIEADSTASLSSIGSGTTIDFAGSDAVLTVTGAPDAIGTGTAIMGFGLGDAIDFQSTDITRLTRTFEAGRTILTLQTAAGQTEDQISLPGVESNLDFELVTYDPYELGYILLVPISATAPPSFAPVPDPVKQHFIWTGHEGTNWTDPGSWGVVGQPGSSAVPGMLDSVLMRGARDGFTLVSGSGAAATLVISGNVVLDGRFQLGVLRSGKPEIGESVNIIGATNTVDARSVNFGDGFVIITDGAVLQAGTVGDGFYSLSTGASLIADTLQGAALDLDATSRVEVGGSNSGAAGVLTIDAGATARNISVDGTIVDNGRLVTDGNTFADAITGTGAIILQHGEMSVENTLGGRVVRFTGANATLDLSGFTAPVIDQAISGFGVADTLLASQSTDNESFIHYSQGAGDGVLEIVVASGTVLASFDIAGKHDPSYFLLTQAGTLDAVSVLPSRIDHSVSPGTATGHLFAWDGSVNPGDWSDAAAWKDLTTGTTAVVAPGAHDTVELDAVAFGSTFVTGAASIADLEVSFGGTLDGTFLIGTANVVGLSLVGPGTTLQTQNLSTHFNLDLPGLSGLAVDRAHVEVGTADLLNSTNLRDGGFLSAASLTFYDLAIDPTARALLGTLNGSPDALQAGALTIAAGQTLQSATLLDGSLVVDGIMDVESRTEVTRAITGSGTIAIGNSQNPSTLVADASVSVATAIELTAPGATIAFGQAAGPHGTVSGFVAGQTLDFAGILNATHAVFEAAGGSGGRLVVEDQSGSSLAVVNLMGSYSAVQFGVTEGASGVAITIATSHA